MGYANTMRQIFILYIILVTVEMKGILRSVFKVFV